LFTETGDEDVIVSTGFIPSITSPQVRRTLKIKSKPNTDPAYFEWAIYARDYMDFLTGYLIDSYDSEAGPYPGAGNGNSYANVGAGGDGTFNSGIELYGSMQLGGLLLDNAPDIYGDNEEGNPNQLILNDPPTPPPAFPDEELAAAQAAANNDLILINGLPFDGGTTLITDSNSDIIIPPGDYYFEYVDLASNQAIEIQPPGEVRFFLQASSPDSDALMLNSNLTWNVEAGIPTALCFFVEQGRIAIASNITIHGRIFAPNSHIFIDSNVEYYGAIVGNTFDMQSNENFHYDEALGIPSQYTGNVLVTSWVEATPQ